ncbi:hypothetical protein HDU91_003589 [Kappamyces sp. JEL0680]|nr:hypothetical protein HDU91_003589 [Kappamyces sp. JEL0680]
MDVNTGGSIFHHPADHLTSFESLLTWWSLLIMGAFFTLGSIIFARPFHVPPKPPLIPRIFRSDEILSAWLFALASVPSVFYVASYLAENLTSVSLWTMMAASILFVLVSFLFLYFTYEDGQPNFQFVSKTLTMLFGDRRWIQHYATSDAISALWGCYLGCFVGTVGSFALMIYNLCTTRSLLEIYTWTTGGLDFLMFTLGFAYLLAGFDRQHTK